MSPRRVLALACFACAALPLGAAVAADHVYVADPYNGAIYQFSTDASGGLQPLAPSNVSVPQGANILLMTPDARNLFTTQYQDDLQGFSVGAGGLLSPGVQTGFANARGENAAISPDGHSLYQTDNGDWVKQWDLGADGSLTAKSPDHVDGMAQSFAVIVSPDGHSVYASDLSGIHQFDVAADGTLSPKTPAIVTTSNDVYYGMAMTPDGRHLYGASNGAIQQYDVGTGGLLSPMTPATAAAGQYTRFIVVSPDGRSAYATNEGDKTISQYDITANGTLAPKTPATVTVTGYPTGVAVSPDDRSLYVSTRPFQCGPGTTGEPPTRCRVPLTGYIEQFNIGTGGALTPKSVPVVTVGMITYGIVVAPDQGPAAGLGAATGTAETPTTLDASGSTDSDGTVARYDWDFGDGQTASTTSPTTTHTYAAPGAYASAVTVTDDDGCSTAFVFTGQTASCAGGPKARATATTSVASAPVSPAPDVPLAIIGGGVSSRCTRLGTLLKPPTGHALSASYDLTKDATVTYTVLHRDRSPRWKTCPPLGGTKPITWSAVTTTSGPGTAGANTTVIASTASVRSHRPHRGVRMRRGHHRISLARIARARHLHAGTYMLRISATDAAGAHSNTVQILFWILR